MTKTVGNYRKIFKKFKKWTWCLHCQIAFALSCTIWDYSLFDPQASMQIEHLAVHGSKLQWNPFSGVGIIKLAVFKKRIIRDILTNRAPAFGVIQGVRRACCWYLPCCMGRLKCSLSPNLGYWNQHVTACISVMWPNSRLRGVRFRWYDGNTRCSYHDTKDGLERLPYLFPCTWEAQKAKL